MSHTDDRRAMENIPDFGSEYEQMESHYNRLQHQEQARHGATMFSVGVIEGLRQALHAIKTDKDKRQPSRNWPGMNAAMAAVEEAIAKAEETKRAALLAAVPEKERLK